MRGGDLEHFRAKWEPVRVKEMRPNKTHERFRDSIILGTDLEHFRAKWPLRQAQDEAGSRLRKCDKTNSRAAP